MLPLFIYFILIIHPVFFFVNLIISKLSIIIDFMTLNRYDEIRFFSVLLS